MENRQTYYFQGQKYEKNEELAKAIEAYEQYSNFLNDSDKHIPFQWISKLYEGLDDEANAIRSLVKFAEGCSKYQRVNDKSIRAAQVYTEIGKRWEKLGNYEKAIEAYENAVENDDTVSLKSRMERIKREHL